MTDQWRAYEHQSGLFWVVVSSDGNFEDVVASEIDEPTARLIAAAPDMALALEPFAAVAEFIAVRNLPADLTWLWQPTTSHGSQPPGITRGHVDAALVAFKAAGRAPG